jgi:hypothetical protein
MKKFKIGQQFIVKESLKDADWYKPGIFYLKKIHPAGTIKMQNTQDKNTMNKYELFECHNAYGEVLICHESKLINPPLDQLRDEKITILLKDNLF